MSEGLRANDHHHQAYADYRHCCWWLLLHAATTTRLTLQATRCLTLRPPLPAPGTASTSDPTALVLLASAVLPTVGPLVLH